MFVDTRNLEEGAVVEADVCIVGGGVAGITLALEMERRGISTCLLESGGFRPDDATRDLYHGESIGLPYEFADGCRSRYLGGSSNLWGGWCRPLDSHDLQQRSWVPDSGWPFERSELEPYYERSHPLLKLGPYNYDPAFWEHEIGRADVRRLPFDGKEMVDIISQFSPPMRFGSYYRDDLGRAKNVAVFLFANAVDVQTNADACVVRSILIKTLTQRAVTCRARTYVLAAGGIENARILLSSDAVQKAGLGNAHDLVGRYYMDHPRVYWGFVRPKDSRYRNKFYDVKFHYLNRAVSAHGTCVAANFKLHEDVQRREGLLNAQMWFTSVFPGEGSDAMHALVRLKHAFHKSEKLPGFSLPRDLLMLAAHPVDTLGFSLARLFQPASWIKHMRLTAMSEPDPNPRSRILLSDERDALGMRRVKIDWQMSDLVIRTFDRNFAHAAAELERQGIWEVTPEPPLAGRAWPNDFPPGTWHHMGSTRMHEDPHRGVVDRNGQVHGIPNLYVAGSSVFPTGGANLPTITITALALRLADRIAALTGRQAASSGPTVERSRVAAG